MSTVATTIDRDGILAIARYPLSIYSGGVFPRATTVIERDTIKLTLGNSVICYPTRIDTIVKNWQLETHKHNITMLYVAFREHELGIVTQAPRLEKRVIAIIERSLMPAPAAEQETTSLQKMDELFRAGHVVRNQAVGKKIVLLIGSSGVGKSTAANFYCGCEMLQVSKTLFGEDPLVEDSPPQTIIAKNARARIGQTTESETFYPEIIESLDTRSDSNFDYCDCPGGGDSRGTAVNYCNAFSIVDIIKRAKAIQATLLFCDFQDIGAARLDKLSKDVKYLQMLLKTFNPHYHKDNLKFVITKHPRGRINLDMVAAKIEAALRLLMRNNAHDQALVNFCNAMLEHRMHTKIILCDPLAPEQREEAIRTIRNCTPINVEAERNTLTFGYPLDADSMSRVMVMRNAIAASTQEALTRLKENFKRFWEGRITGAITVPAAKEIYERLDTISRNAVAPLSLPHFANDNAYAIAAENNPQQRLNECLEYWNKAKELQPPNDNDNIDVRLRDSFNGFAHVIKTLCTMAQRTYYNLMYQEITKSVGTILRSYVIQRSVIDRGNALGNLTTMDLPTLIRKLNELSTETCSPIPHADLMNTILSADLARVEGVKNMLEENLKSPMTVIGVDTLNIKVTANAQNIALSQVIRRIGEVQINEGGKPKELQITAKSPTGFGTLYFDRNLNGDTFKGKTIIIIADRVNIMIKSSVNLALTQWRGGTFLLKGGFLGTIPDNEGLDLILEPPTGPNPQYVQKLITRNW